MRFFRLLAIVTLLANAYILLSLVATRRMKPEYHHYLPPFDREDLAAIPDGFWLGLVAWTAALAVGCLRRRGATGAEGKLQPFSGGKEIAKPDAATAPAGRVK